ncbi:MAG: type II toxin-antitoxin system HicA family toxin [Actinomycetota bacterium]|nr:type II toxin-antitoxin system HicA family toxin [Actinomycetota bacterium]
MNSRALLRRLAGGDVANVRFSDLRRLLGDLGFERVRVSGSHEIYSHPSIPELVNLQEVKAQAKQYQLRQLVRLVERYDLRLEDRG